MTAEEIAFAWQKALAHTRGSQLLVNRRDLEAFSQAAFESGLPGKLTFNGADLTAADQLLPGQCAVVVDSVDWRVKL